MEYNDLIWNIVVSMITGFISGWLVYVWTTKREEKKQAKTFLESYIFSSLEKCDIYFPIELIKKISLLESKNSNFKESVFELINALHPENTEEREYTEQEAEVFKKALKAMEELSKIK